MGLLLTHKCKIRVFPDMVTVSPIREHKARGGGKRGDIQGFSRDSRYRLFRLLHSIQFETVSFVTLTYGKTFPEKPETAKKHLREFRRVTEQKWGKIRGIWRMEYQEREAIHFHIMYFDAPFIPVQEWCAVWDKARHSPKDEIFHNSLDLKFNADRLQSRLIGYYVGKYISKPDTSSHEGEDIKPGRLWGRWNIEDPEPVEVEMYEWETKELSNQILPKEPVGGWLPLSPDSYTCFGPQMGQSGYQARILGLCTTITEKRKKPVKRNVTKVTCVFSPKLL